MCSVATYYSLLRYEYRSSINSALQRIKLLARARPGCALGRAAKRLKKKLVRNARPTHTQCGLVLAKRLLGDRMNERTINRRATAVFCFVISGGGNGLSRESASVFQAADQSAAAFAKKKCGQAGADEKTCDDTRLRQRLA